MALSCVEIAWKTKKLYSHSFSKARFIHNIATPIATSTGTEIIMHTAAAVTRQELRFVKAAVAIKEIHHATINAKTIGALFAGHQTILLDCVAISIWYIKKKATLIY